MISVIVPTRGSPDLEECLDSLWKQTKQPGEIIIVADKRNILQASKNKKYKARVVLDKHGTIGGAYAAGARAAKGSIVAFIDDDCIAPPGWLEKIEKEFDDDVDVVSGEDLLPENSSFFQKAAYQIDKARIMKTAVYGEKAKNRLKAANIAYRKKVFDKHNFNPKLKGLQEPEFHHRLFKSGFKMKFNPSIHVYHKRRGSLLDIFNQIYRNGKAKIALLRMHSDMVSRYDFLIFAYISLFLASAVSFQGNPSYFYSVLAVTGAYFLLRPLRYILLTKEIVYYPWLVAIVFTREVAYAFGLIVGLKNLLIRE